MAIRVGINGYGRIGRNILRALYESGRTGEIGIVAVNDLGLDALYVFYPGELRYDIDDTISAMPAGVPLSISDTGKSLSAPASALPDE